MRILMVAPFPPLRDGVGKYAAQEVAALRKEGHTVDVLAPVACAAHRVVNFKRGLGLLRLRRRARRYDKVILHYQPGHFHLHAWGPSRVLSNLWMAITFMTMRKLIVVCHEVEYPPTPRSRWRLEMVLAKLAWRSARHLEFHTTLEVSEMEQRLGVRPRRVQVRDHGRYFRSSVVESRSMARHKLGLDEAQTLLLCIGFIQPQKGFDRAIRAFRRIPGEAKLAVVGSLTYETNELRAYMNELEALAATDERVEVREQMVSDDEFDRWILASDALVLPYRLIWSSGVIERAHLLGRNVVVSSAGGLPEQLGSGDTMVTNDEELAEAMAKVVGGGTPLQPAPLTAREAAELLEVESRRLGVGTEVDRALNALHDSQGVLPVLHPSERRLVGPFLDLVKRAMRRSMGWLLTPLIGQINEFQRRTTDALEAIVDEQRKKDDEES